MSGASACTSASSVSAAPSDAIGSASVLTGGEAGDDGGDIIAAEPETKTAEGGAQ